MTKTAANVPKSRTRGAPESRHVNNNRPQASRPHPEHTRPEQPRVYPQRAATQTDKDTRRKAAFRSATTYLSMSWRRWGKTLRLPPTQKLSRSGFLLSSSSLTKPPKKKRRRRKRSPKSFLVPVVWRSGVLWLSQWVGWLLLWLLARAACVYCDAGHFALVSPAPFLEICVSRSAVA